MKNTIEKDEIERYMFLHLHIEKVKKSLVSAIKDAYFSEDYKEILNKAFYLWVTAKDFPKDGDKFSNFCRLMIFQEFINATSGKDLLELAEGITKIAKEIEEKRDEKNEA